MALKQRLSYLKQIDKAFRTHKVVAILGPRQCGKTTLSKLFLDHKKASKEVHHFDLEDPADLRALENPKTALESLNGLIILDEIQRLPDLFPILRVLVDQTTAKREFLILGSASRDLIRQSAETLAGRIAYIELTPFSLLDIKAEETKHLWLRGGFPRSFLAKSISDSVYWRTQYITTFLERDIPNLGIRIPPSALRRFWMMLAHYHGQVFNASELGRSLGIADTTVRHYLDILTGTFMIRQLQPWIANIKKRQVKSPKIYFRDSGLFHTLSDISTYDALIHHPKLGASWEGFALEQTIDSVGATSEEIFFWGVHGQGELDLLVMQNGKKIGYEFKFNDAPKLTRSMELALQTLKLDKLNVIYPGSKPYQLADSIYVSPVS